MKKWFLCLLCSFLLASCTNKERQDYLLSSIQEDSTLETSQSPAIETQQEDPLQFEKSKRREFYLSDSFEEFSSFVSNPIINENKASYQLHTKLDESGTFTNIAEITIENLSENQWNEIVFQMIPNTFTKENKPKEMYYSNESSVHLVKIDDQNVPFELHKDTLLLQLNEPFKKNEKKVVTVEYSFTVPELSFRFNKWNENYYLAQWYPMLSPYQNGWVKESFVPVGEFYHTDFSDFTVTYELPEDYYILSSSSDDPSSLSSSGTLSLENSKEFYLALLKDKMIVKSTELDGIEIRVSSNKLNEPRIDLALDIAKSALAFYQKHLGPYPHKQLDLIFDESYMEYPGIVTVGGYKDRDLIHVVGHEVAHQWFYGMVTNNPYYDSVVDEGMTDFVTYLFESEYLEILPYEAFAPAHMNKSRAVQGRQQQLAHIPLNEYSEMGFASANYATPSLELWKLAGTTENALNFVNTYFKTYAYKELDTQEWIRFTKSYFKIDDNSIFESWISLE